MKLMCFCCVLCTDPVKLVFFCFLSCAVHRSSEANVFLLCDVHRSSEANVFLLCDVQRSSEANVFLLCAVQRSEGDDQEREKQRRELEAANDILHKEIEKLEQALKYTEGLVSELAGSLADGWLVYG